MLCTRSDDLKVKSTFCSSNKRVLVEHSIITVIRIKYDNADIACESKWPLQNMLFCCKIMFWTFFNGYILDFCLNMVAQLKISICIVEPLFYLEVYYKLNTFVFNHYLKHSKCRIFTKLMPKVSTCLICLKKISGINEKNHKINLNWLWKLGCANPQCA